MTYRVVCTWVDDKAQAWSHSLGPYTERRDAYATFHAETCRRHNDLGRPGAHDLVVEILTDEDGRTRTIDRWPGPWPPVPAATAPITLPAEGPTQ